MSFTEWTCLTSGRRSAMGAWLRTTRRPALSAPRACEPCAVRIVGGLPCLTERRVAVEACIDLRHDCGGRLAVAHTDPAPDGSAVLRMKRQLGSDRGNLLQ